MKILVLLPSSKKFRSIFYRFSDSSITLQQLATITPKEHKVYLIDENFENINFDKDYDLIGISSYTPMINRAYEIADEFRRRGRTVVLGGWHPSALPEESKEHADSVVIGEAEETWPVLLKDLEKNQLKPFYYQKRPVPPDLIGKPLDIKLKGHKKGVQSTRGCPNNCFFCSISSAKHRNIYRKRPIKEIVEEIKSLQHKTFAFQDASLTIDLDYSKKLFKEIACLNKKFGCSGNANVLGRDEELLKLASNAGCTQWLVGFESISQDSINAIGKKTNQVENYSKTIEKIHDYGMTIKGEFIFGFDTDKKDIFEKTMNTLNKLDLDMVDFYILTPLPGTPLYDLIKKQGRILTYDWSKYNCKNVVFKPKNMTAKELYNGTRMVGKEMHSLKNIAKGFIINIERNTAVWTTINNISNRMYYKKFN